MVPNSPADNLYIYIWGLPFLPFILSWTWPSLSISSSLVPRLRLIIILETLFRSLLIDAVASEYVVLQSRPFVVQGCFLFLDGSRNWSLIRSVSMHSVDLLKKPNNILGDNQWWTGILFRSYLSYFVTLLYEKQLHSVLFRFISDHPMTTTALSVTGYLFIDCTWISVYLITSELFPTVLR